MCLERATEMQMCDKIARQARGEDINVLNDLEKLEWSNKMVECVIALYDWCNQTHCDKCPFHERSKEYCLIGVPVKWGAYSRMSIKELLTP